MIDVEFSANGRAWRFRGWPMPPRVGDKVDLADADNQHAIVGAVASVTWLSGARVRVEVLVEVDLVAMERERWTHRRLPPATPGPEER